MWKGEAGGYSTSWEVAGGEEGVVPVDIDASAPSEPDDAWPTTKPEPLEAVEEEVIEPQESDVRSTPDIRVTIATADMAACGCMEKIEQEIKRDRRRWEKRVEELWRNTSREKEKYRKGKDEEETNRKADRKVIGVWKMR